MNLFAVDPDPVRAARSLCDRHVVKMTTETAQILCTVAHLRGHAEAPYRRTHPAHPAVIWAGARRANWIWTVRHGLALADEYERRYGRVHASRKVIEWCLEKRAGPRDRVARRQPFVQVMPEELRGEDAVLAYRRFYNERKASFARWKPPARAPHWFRPSA